MSRAENSRQGNQVVSFTIANFANALDVEIQNNEKFMLSFRVFVGTERHIAFRNRNVDIDLDPANQGAFKFGDLNSADNRHLDVQRRCDDKFGGVDRADQL